MEPKINPETMKQTIDIGYDIFCRKNHDYGNSFELSIDKRGPIAAMVRLEDKFNRADELILKPSKVNDESLIDTLIDMGNYAYMLATYLKGCECNATRQKSTDSKPTGCSNYPD